jgi:hypothetical protein
MEADHNPVRPTQEHAVVSLSENERMEAEYRLIEARPFLQVLASIVTRLYGERSEEPLLTEQSSAEQSNE